MAQGFRGLVGYVLDRIALDLRQSQVSWWRRLEAAELLTQATWVANWPEGQDKVSISLLLSPGSDPLVTVFVNPL